MATTKQKERKGPVGSGKGTEKKDSGKKSPVAALTRAGAEPKTDRIDSTNVLAGMDTTMAALFDGKSGSAVVLETVQGLVGNDLDEKAEGVIGRKREKWRTSDELQGLNARLEELMGDLRTLEEGNDTDITKEVKSQIDILTREMGGFEQGREAVQSLIEAVEAEIKEKREEILGKRKEKRNLVRQNETREKAITRLDGKLDEHERQMEELGEEIAIATQKKDELVEKLSAKEKLIRGEPEQGFDVVAESFFENGTSADYTDSGNVLYGEESEIAGVKLTISGTKGENVDVTVTRIDDGTTKHAVVQINKGKGKQIMLQEGEEKNVKIGIGRGKTTFKIKVKEITGFKERQQVLVRAKRHIMEKEIGEIKREIVRAEDSIGVAQEVLETYLQDTKEEREGILQDRDSKGREIADNLERIGEVDGKIETLKAEKTREEEKKAEKKKEIDVLGKYIEEAKTGIAKLGKQIEDLPGAIAAQVEEVSIAIGEEVERLQKGFMDNVQRVMEGMQQIGQIVAKIARETLFGKEE